MGLLLRLMAGHARQEVGDGAGLVDSPAGGVSRVSWLLLPVALLFMVLLVLLPARAWGESICTDTWTGPSEGPWLTAADWSTGKVPTSTDVACVGTGKTVKVTEGANHAAVVQGEGTISISGGSLEIMNALEISTIKGLSVLGGTLTGSAAVEVTGSFTAGSGGVLSGSGSTLIKAGATGTISAAGGTLGLEERTLKNAGTLTLSKSSGGISGSKGAQLVNTGTVEKTEGSGFSLVSFVVDNEGTISTTAGQLKFSGGGTAGGSKAGSWLASGTGTGIVVEANGSEAGPVLGLGPTVTLSGSVEVREGKVTAGKVEGSGASITLNGFGTNALGTLEVTGASASTVHNLTITNIGERAGGQLLGSAEVDVTGSFTATGGSSGTMGGSGSTVIESGATGTISGHGLRLEERTFTNAGTLTMIGNSSSITGGKKAKFVNTGTLIINGEGAGEGPGLSAEENEATFTNSGTLEKTEGTGKSVVSFGFINLGSIIEATGKFEITHPIFLAEPATQYGAGEGENLSVLGHPESKCGDPVSCATGNFSEMQTDFSVGGRGVGLNLARTYNSQAGAEEAKGAFGYGWSSSFSDHLVVNKTSKVTTLHQADGSTVPFTEGTGGSFTPPAWTQDTLSGTEGTGYTLTLASQVKYKFAGTSGRLESVTDRDGNAATLTYNEAGQLTTITDPTSRTIKLAYNGEGLVESAEDPTKHVVKYTYEGGNLKSVTQPAEAGLRWQFKYDGSHQMTEMTDGRGGKTINEYNEAHKVTSQKDPLEHKLTFEYEPFHTKITNVATGSITDEHFTSNDEPFSITHGFGTASATTESLTYNEGGYVTSVTDGNGHATKYEYDASSNRTKMVDANSNETKWTYDTTHDVETMTTPKGEVTTIKREAHGNPETIERPAPGSKTQITKYKYKTTGELESLEDPLKRVWKYEYDTHGNRTAEIDPLSNKRTWEYNEDSQETATVSPRGNVAGGKPAEFTTKTERDAQGRAIKVTDPLAHTTKYVYDGDGNVETLTDGNSHTTKYTYNADNQPTKVEAPNKAITETGYDGANEVTSQVDGNKHETKYVRNVLEQVTEVTDPLGHKTTKEYDLAGNLKKTTDPATRTTTYTYDPGNRLTEVVYSSGKPSTIKYEYDKDDDRTSVTDGTGTSKYTYDQLDRLTEAETGHKEKSKYEYDLSNEKTKITYPNTKAVTRAFDKDGRLEKVTDWSANVTKFTYNPDSEQVTTLFPSATKDEDKFAYNDADQMTESKMLKLLEVGSETLASLVYTRDSNGQVKKTTAKGLPGAEITENTYDENSRLTKSGSEYKYDAANNPTTIGTGTYKYNAGSELETGPSLTYTYDELGERTKTKPTSGPAITYGYDQAENMTSVERPKEGEIAEIKDTYAYDGNSLRASQTISGTTSYLVWDMTEGLPLMLSDETNSYIHGPGGVPVEQVSSGGTVTYLHHDQQGSIRLLTGSAGTTTGSITFDAYGKKIESTGTTSALGYDGQYTSSDTGLVYLRARVYDPASAQFLTVDPLVGETGAPYNYAGDNPLNYGDPTGLDFFDEAAEGVAGWGDGLTFGATKWVREELGINNVNTCSTAYQTGGYAGLATAVLLPGTDEAELGGILRRIATRLADETGTIGRYGNLGNLAERADETVADVIRSRGGGASQINELQSGYGQLTLGEISDLTARGDPEAAKALKMVKQAGTQGKGGK